MFYEALPSLRKLSICQSTNRTKMRADYLPHSDESLGSEWSSCWRTWPPEEEEEKDLSPHWPSQASWPQPPLYTSWLADLKALRKHTNHLHSSGNHRQGFSDGIAAQSTSFKCFALEEQSKTHTNPAQVLVTLWALTFLSAGALQIRKKICIKVCITQNILQEALHRVIHTGYQFCQWLSELLKRRSPLVSAFIQSVLH